jgi:DNA-binding transcriptional LysR family regulator
MNLGAMAQRLRNGGSPQLRIGASEVVLRRHLPEVIERLKQKHPKLRLGLRSGFDTELAAWLRDGQVDVIITPLAGRPPARTRCAQLLRLPLALLVPRKWKVRAADELWAKRRLELPLISMPPRESVSVLFQSGLRRRGIDWPVTIEASSIELITDYVANGRGAGVSVMLPEIVRHPRVQVLELAGFETMAMAALWHGEPAPVLRDFLEEGLRYAREKWAEPVPEKQRAAAA